jgi:hypothetical protein
MKKRGWKILVIGLVLFVIAMSSFALAVTAKECNDRYHDCRAAALSSNAGVIATTLALTACDAGYSVCLFRAVSGL